MTDTADAYLQTARALRRAMASASPELAPHLARALRIVVRSDGVRPGVLAEQMRIAPRTATESVDGLVERGLAERRPDPDDRRAQLVVATPAGLEVHDRVGAARADAARAFFAVLSAEQRAQLDAVLAVLDEDAGARGVDPRGIVAP